MQKIMESNTKQAILQQIPHTQVWYDAAEGRFKKYVPQEFDPDLVLCDKKNMYCVIGYAHLNFSDLHGKYYTYRNSNTWLLQHYYLEDHYQECQKQFGQDIALCLMNLFIDVLCKFNNFHKSDHSDCYGSYDKLFHCVIFVPKQHYALVRKTLEIVRSAYKHPLEENSIVYHTVGEDHLLSLNIAVFYTLIDPLLFASRMNHQVILGT